MSGATPTAVELQVLQLVALWRQGPAVRHDPVLANMFARLVYAVGDLQAWADRGVKSSTTDPGHDRISPARRPDRDPAL